MGIKILRCLILSFLLSQFSCFASMRKDSITNEAKFYNIGLLKVSEDGKWAAVSKMYKNNSDTVVILKTRSSQPNTIVATLTKMSHLSFLKGDRILASGNGVATVYNLKSGNIKGCKVELKGINREIKESGGLTNGQEYYLLTKDGFLLIYNSESLLIHQIENVKELKTDKPKSQLYIIKNINQGEEIMRYSNGSLLTVYRTYNVIKHSEFSYSGNFFLLREDLINQDTSIERLQRVVFLELNSREIIIPEVPALKHKDFLRFTEIQDGKAIMVTAIEHTPFSEGTVDIWYGNDGNLDAKQSGLFTYRHWVWKASDHSTYSLPKDRFSVHFSLDDPNYFIAFNGDELQNYNTQFPLINAYLYDRKNDHYSNLGTMYPEIISSPYGKYFLYRDKENLWMLVNRNDLTKKQLSVKGLRKPRFSSDNQSIVFESQSSLWHYSIGGDKFKKENVDENYQMKILVPRDKNLYPQSGYEFTSNSIDLNNQFIVMASKNNSPEQIFFRWNKGKMEKLVASADSNIKWAEGNNSQDCFFYTEESLNYPPRIMFKEKRSKDVKVIFESNSHDHLASVIRKEIKEYKSSDGKTLKGILYYPIVYDGSKKYPMVVHIYEIQSKNTNQYLSPLNNFPVGFSIRKLLEKGYFVYLPDVVNDMKGIGWSVLACVNRAMDAVQKNPNIDMENVGLIGHSFGGYQTNFIATHSNRFKAYISGAGAADIVRMYFSYNYTSLSPFYWQFQEGQYNMPTSFARDKKLYVDNSPIQNVENVNAPILLWTGKNDQRIVWDQTMEFYIGLKKNNKDVVALFYPGQAHNLAKGSNAESDLDLRILNWWDYFLKGKEGFVWIRKQIKKDAD